MARFRTTSVQVKPRTSAPRGGEAEARCSVTFPEQGSPRGIVHFVGGAVVGAAPDLTYGYMIERLAGEGFTVVQTAYPFTFRHRALAADLKDTFNACIAELRANGRGTLAPAGCPTHGVGHSNGALMHLLIGSMGGADVASNVLMSYNNKEVADAIPIPNFVEGVRPYLQQGREAGLALGPDTVRQRVEEYLQTRALVPSTAMQQLGPVLSQLSSCLEEIEDGVTDFDPSPSESRNLIASKYAVRDSLLVRFADDGIDETPELTQLLMASRAPGSRIVHERTLPGTHITPCGGPGGSEISLTRFSALDAISMAARLVLFQDTVRATDVVLDWLARFD